jgi:hypothetical protein
VFEGPRVDGEGESEDAGEWRRRGVLAAADGSDLNGFGRAVAVDGGTTLVGAPLARVSGGTAGAVYAFDAVDATRSTRRSRRDRRPSAPRRARHAITTPMGSTRTSTVTGA